jgi:hypothetical protein
VVEQLTTYGDPWYMVTMPYSWSVKNGKKSQRGKATALAIVVPGHYEGSNKAAYFIAALWNANNEKSVRLAQKN